MQGEQFVAHLVCIELCDSMFNGDSCPMYLWNEMVAAQAFETFAE